MSPVLTSKIRIACSIKYRRTVIVTSKTTHELAKESTKVIHATDAVGLQHGTSSERPTKRPFVVNFVPVMNRTNNMSSQGESARFLLPPTSCWPKVVFGARRVIAFSLFHDRNNARLGGYRDQGLRSRPNHPSYRVVRQAPTRRMASVSPRNQACGRRNRLLCGIFRSVSFHIFIVCLRMS